MFIIKKICTIIDTVVEATGRVFACICTLTAVTILTEVVCRRLFQAPQIWTNDIILYTFGIYAVLVTSYGLLNGSFVRVDILVSRFPPIVEHIIHFITYFVFMWPFLINVTLRSYPFFLRSFSIGEKQYSVWSPIIWPVKLGLCIGFTILCITALSVTLKELLWIAEYFRNGKQAPPPIKSLSLLKPIEENSAPKEVDHQ